MIRFRLFGFPVQVQPFFWLLCLLLGMNELQRGGADGVGRFLLLAAIVFGSILIHELGHALARRQSGAPHSEITLHGFGGICSGPGQFTRGQSIFISAAGPLASIALGAVVWIFASTVGTSDPWIRFAVGWLLWVNIGWAILNLLPIYPLDGGQIFAGIAGPRNLRLVVWTGLILSVIFAVVGLTRGLLFMGILFGLLAWGNWQRLQGQRASFP